MKDAPADGVVTFQIDVTGATLTDSGSRSAVLSSSVQDMEVRGLELAPTLAFRASNAKSGDYTTVNLMLSNPRLTLADALGNVTQVNGSTTPSVQLARSGVNVPLSVSVAAAGSVGLMLDFDLQQSIHTDANGNFIIDPVLKASVINNSGSEMELVDSLGTITTIPSSPANSVEVRLLKSDKTVLVRTDSNTRFASEVGQFSSLQVGQMLELNAEFQSDGTFLAKDIDLGPSDPSAGYQGLVARVRQDAAGISGFDVIIQK